MMLTLTSVCGLTATTGTLTCPGLALVTIELPWRDNEPNASCVPAGEYELIPYVSPKHGPTWRLHAPELGVWGRSMAPEGMRTEIELHPGTWASDSEGCVLTGTTAGELFNPKTQRMDPAIFQSRIAFERLRTLLDGTSETDSLLVIRSGAYSAPKEG